MQVLTNDVINFIGATVVFIPLIFLIAGVSKTPLSKQFKISYDTVPFFTIALWSGLLYWLWSLALAVVSLVEQLGI